MTASAPTACACRAWRTAVCRLSAPTLAVTLTRRSTALHVSSVSPSRSSLDKRRTSDTIPRTTPCAPWVMTNSTSLARAPASKPPVSAKGVTRTGRTPARTLLIASPAMRHVLLCRSSRERLADLHVKQDLPARTATGTCQHAQRLLVPVDGVAMGNEAGGLETAA